MPHSTEARRFSERDLRIITGYARGHTAAQIAGDLDTYEDNVRRRTTRLAKDLGITGARQAALVDYAYRYGHIRVARRRVLGPLPPRMAEALEFAAQGIGFRAMADALGISPFTARSHRERLRKALGATTVAHAVAIAWEAGLLGVPGERSAS
jgi:DNA-binding NarL/FixJ family response regulator